MWSLDSVVDSLVDTAWTDMIIDDRLFVSVIFNFNFPNIHQSLQLDVGDTVRIFEECEGENLICSTPYVQGKTNGAVSQIGSFR